jgi:hypothetical protein
MIVTEEAPTVALTAGQETNVLVDDQTPTTGDRCWDPNHVERVKEASLMSGWMVG